MAAISVHLPAFDGPLELLLHLIRSHKLDIYDIPIARVADQYVQALAGMEALDVNVAGEFLVMAATLMEIKSRLLLPQHPGLTAAEGEEAGVDPREELVRRLVEYNQFQAASETLRTLESERALHFPRGGVTEVESLVPLILPEPAALMLLGALRHLLDEAGAEEPVTTLRREHLTLRMKMREAWALLRDAGEDGLEFHHLFRHGGSRAEIIATFLAILELLRQRRIRVVQQQALGEIRIFPVALPAPDGEE